VESLVHERFAVVCPVDHIGPHPTFPNFAEKNGGVVRGQITFRDELVVDRR
jgi:hypothetical protein